MKQLSGNGESEESKMLAQSLDVLDKQHAETVEQVEIRRQAVDSRLSQWIDFDNSYQRLLADISALDETVDATKVLAAEDAIVKIEQVSLNDRRKSVALLIYEFTVVEK